MKMKQKRFFWLVLLIGFSLSGQIKGVVVDANNQPISYVNITVENENTGTTSEENGEFSVSVSEQNKELIFSAMGYETLKLAAADTKKVVMSAAIYKLNEVIVTKPKRTKEVEVGNSKNRYYLPEPQTAPWILAKNINRDTINKDISHIKNLIFFTNSEVEGASFRARIYRIAKDGLPGIDMISESIIVKTKKGKHKTIVDVSSYDIEMPKEGIIVGFESLLIDSNKYMEKAGIINSKKTIYILNYGPHIMYTNSDLEESYTFRAGKWTKQRFSMYINQKTKSKVISPAINVTLTD